MKGAGSWNASGCDSTRDLLAVGDAEQRWESSKRFPCGGHEVGWNKVLERRFADLCGLKLNFEEERTTGFGEMNSIQWDLEQITMGRHRRLRNREDCLLVAMLGSTRSRHGMENRQNRAR